MGDACDEWTNVPIPVHVSEVRRRMVCESLSGLSSTLPTGGAIASPQDGIPTGLWLVAVLALAFMVYWFVVRRFVRQVPKRRPRLSELDLEAGLPRKVLHLQADRTGFF